MTNRLARVKLYITVAIFAAGSLLLAPQHAQANLIDYSDGCSGKGLSVEFCTLADLFRDPTAADSRPKDYIIVDGVKFFDFIEVETINEVSNVLDPLLPDPDYGLVKVFGRDVTDNPGLAYDLGGQFVTDICCANTFGLNFTFTVDTFAFDDIKDTSVAGVLLLTGSYEGTVSINQIINPPTPGLSDITASITDPIPMAGLLQFGPATDTFDEQSSISVDTTFLIEDVLEFAVELASFTQHFSQSNFGTAPEPATLFLLGGGLAALGWMRRRRNG